MNSTRFGWSYLVVTATPLPDDGGQTHRARYSAIDMGDFEDERTMLRELGATGWELVTIREAPTANPADPPILYYYFKRTRT